MVTNYCLGIVLNTKLSHVLLIRKNGGPFPGKFNGLGGHIEEGEHPQQAMIRELAEEGSKMFNTKADIVSVPLCCMSFPNEVNLYVYGIRVSAQKCHLNLLQPHEEGYLSWYPLELSIDNWIWDPWSDKLAGDGNLPYFIRMALENFRKGEKYWHSLLSSRNPM
jgi:hypothetical protein